MRFSNPICCAVLALTMAASIAHAQESAPAEKAGASLIAVEALPAKRTLMEKHVPLTGSLIARQEVVVFPKVTGYAVTELLADVGDRVEAGEALARLQDETLAALHEQAKAERARAEAGIKQAQSQIASAEATLTEAVTTLERNRRLRASGNMSQAALDQAVTAEATARASSESARDGLSVAQAALAQSDASLRVAQLNLDYTRITAPVAGTVVERNANLGELSGSSGLAMFRIVANDEIELAAEVIENAIPELSVGIPVQVDIAGLGRVEGAIRLLPAQVSPETRLGALRVSLKPVEGLRAGLFAWGWVVTQSREALSVPTTAVLNDGGSDFVQIATNGVIETRPVKAGLVWEGRREILEGLKGDELVLSRAGAFFRDGDAVRVIAPDAKGSTDEAAQ